MSSHTDDTALDEALAGLSRPDLDPITARALQVAAQRKLSASLAPTLASWSSARESLLLCALSLAQLVWAAARVLALLH